MPGKLILCATPIGNLADASSRLREALKAADVVYVEDTRRARVLLEALGVAQRTRSYFVGNEAARARELGEHLALGRTVALLTDAGTPAISDPGLSAVRSARAAGAEVTAVPGPSAVTTALAVSGLPADRFVFEGFLPRKGSARRQRLRLLAGEERTIVIFTTAERLAADLEDLAAAVGQDRPVVVTRELTKVYEEVWEGRLDEAVERWAGPDRVRGELTLVLAGSPGQEEPLQEAVEQALALMASGTTLTEAVRAAAAGGEVSRRLVYQAVLARTGRSS